MVVKRTISNDKKLKLAGSKVYKGKDITTMSDIEKEHLLKLCAEKLGLI